MDGWAVFDRLKNDPSTRHIPIHIMSVEEQAPKGLPPKARSRISVKPVAKEALTEAPD